MRLHVGCIYEMLTFSDFKSIPAVNLRRCKKYLIPSKEQGSAAALISGTVVHWTAGAGWRGYLWPSAPGAAAAAAVMCR